MRLGRIWAGVLAAALAACSRHDFSQAPLSDAQILQALNQRAGAHACCFYLGRDDHGRPLYGQLNGARELHFVVRSLVGGEAVACGWSGFAAPQGPDGRRMQAGPDAIFIVRGGKVYLGEDLPAREFDRWQDEICGPAWVKPRQIGAIP